MKDRIDNTIENRSWLSTAFERNPYAQDLGVELKDYCQQHWAEFSKRGLPTRKEESWKYTDLSFLDKQTFEWALPQLPVLPTQGPLADYIKARAQDSILLVFINGYFVPQHSTLENLPQGVILDSMQQSLRSHAALMSAYMLRDVDAKHHPLACLNAAMMADGLFLYAPRFTVLEKPIHILSLALGSENFMMQPRHLVILEGDTQVTLVEEYRALNADHYWVNASIDCYVGRDASLKYYKIQNEAKNAKHYASLFFHQKQNSEVNAGLYAQNTQFSRNDMKAMLQEQHAVCRVKGFYGLNADGQVIDNHLFIDHAAAHTESEMDFRGILSKQSRAVFNGKVIVRSGAKKIQALQMNHNLLLSAMAEVNTKPELEIYADDVKCRHGATVGQLDEEALFYLRARGIDRETAVALLLQAFVNEVMADISLPWLLESLQEQGKELSHEK